MFTKGKGKAVSNNNGEYTNMNSNQTSPWSKVRKPKVNEFIGFHKFQHFLEWYPKKDSLLNNWPLLWLSILRFSEVPQFGETTEGFRTTFL